MSSSQTPQQLLETMTQAGLMPEDKAQQIAARVNEGQADIQTITSALVTRGVITELQEKLLLGEVNGSLLMGEYRLEEKIGSGGMGTVYKACHRVMDRPVALKVLAPEMTQNPQQVQRFMREIKLVGKLQHSNIVMAYDASEHEGIYYLVMELVEGKDLNSIVKSRGPMKVLNSMELIAQAADGFAYAHEKGIVHRDIKPANLLLTNDDIVKILDLGIARLLSDTSLTSAEDTSSTEMTLTNTGHLLGTVPYMAPEHAANPKDADHRSDIYSLGCTLFWLLTGGFPYGGTTAVEMILASYRQPVPDLLERFDIPGRYVGAIRDLQAVIAKMLAKKPEKRYQAMASVARDLRQLISDHAKSLKDYRLVEQVQTQSELMTQTMDPKEAGTMPNRTLLDDMFADTALSRKPRWQVLLERPLAIIAAVGVVTLLVLALLIFQLTGNSPSIESQGATIIVNKIEVPVEREQGVVTSGEIINQAGQSAKNVPDEQNHQEKQVVITPTRPEKDVEVQETGVNTDSTSTTQVTSEQKSLTPKSTELQNLVPLPEVNRVPIQDPIDEPIRIPILAPNIPVELIGYTYQQSPKSQKLRGQLKGEWHFRPRSELIPGKQMPMDMVVKAYPATMQYTGNLPASFRAIMWMQYRDGKKDGINAHMKDDYAIQLRFLNAYGLLKLTLDQYDGLSYQSKLEMCDPDTGELKSGPKSVVLQNKKKHHVKTRYEQQVFGSDKSPERATMLTLDVHRGHAVLFWGRYPIMDASFPTEEVIPEPSRLNRPILELDARVPMKIEMIRLVTFLPGQPMPPPSP